MKVTEFMTACRRRSPLGGLWDVADLHWWWRDGGYGNPEQQLFLEAPSGQALGFILLSEQYDTFDYEILPGHEESEAAATMFRHALGWLKGRLASSSKPESISFFIRDSHSTLRKLAEAEGFRASMKTYVQTALRLPLPEPGSLAPIADNIRSIRETDLSGGRPPVLHTSAAKFSRVCETPLYRPKHHLVGVDPNDQPVAECICWIDQVNDIGVLEPMETHPDHRRRGHGSEILRAALRLISVSGGKFAKVSHYNSNIAAARLYRSLGFRPVFERVVYEIDG